MISLEDKALRDALRSILMQAQEKGYLTPEEDGLVNNMIDRIDKEIIRKTQDRLRLEGQLKQLTLTKRLVIDMIKDTIAAAERAEAREETFKRMKEGKSARETLVIEEEPVKEETPKKTIKKTTTKKRRAKKDDK